MRDLRLFGFRDHGRQLTAVFATRTAMSSAALLSTKIPRASRAKTTKVWLYLQSQFLRQKESACSECQPLS